MHGMLAALLTCKCTQAFFKITCRALILFRPCCEPDLGEYLALDLVGRLCAYLWHAVAPSLTIMQHSPLTSLGFVVFSLRVGKRNKVRLWDRKSYEHNQLLSLKMPMLKSILVSPCAVL